MLIFVIKSRASEKFLDFKQFKVAILPLNYTHGLYDFIQLKVVLGHLKPTKSLFFQGNVALARKFWI